jgi:hypothetical protein
MTRIVEFYGLRRSGIHAIIHWMESNFNQISKTGFLNDVDVWGRNRLIQTVIGHRKRGYKILLLGYEDCDPNKSWFKQPKDKVVIVRDIINVFASRYKAFGKGFVNKKIADLWIQHANHPNIFKYEDFLLDKNKRDNLTQIFNIPNMDVTTFVSACANGSSFIGKQLDTVENLLVRYKMIDFLKETKQLLNDPLIQQTRQKLGYPEIQL